MKTYCKHCSKDKSKHERKTLHCPLPSRSLMPSFGTDVYEEVQEILHTPNAVLTVKWKSSIPNVTDGESTTIVEWRGHELIDDDGDVMQFGYQAVQGVEFTFFVTADSTGQVSEVTLNENGDFYSKVGFGETEEPSTDDVSEIDSVLDGKVLTTWDELKARVDDFVIPLWDKNWVKAEMPKFIDVEYGTDHPLYQEEIDILKEDVKNVEANNYDIILGKPNFDIGMYDDDAGFMFGFKDQGYLDDQSLIENITNLHWKVLQDLNLIDLRSMESYSSIMYRKDWLRISGLPNSEKTMRKEIDAFLSEIYGRSLLDPNAVPAESTEDCKKVLKSLYNVQKAKRTKKVKWGSIEFREFEDQDGGNYTIVTYNDKLISHFSFSLDEY